jgi:hypothetical protein
LLDSRGDFGSSITAQSLGSVKIAGSITGGNWTVAGSAQSIAANAVDAGWTANFTGAIGIVRFVNDGGNLTASSIGALRVAQNIADASINLTGTGTAIGSLYVGDAVTSSQIISAGNIGRVSVGAFQTSNLLAGVSDATAGLPTAASDFSANDSILSFIVRGTTSPYSFSDSNIAAASIGRVLVARVNPNNTGTPFGVATKSLGAFNNRGVLKWTSNQAVNLLTPDGDFVVSLL